MSSFKARIIKLSEKTEYIVNTEPSEMSLFQPKPSLTGLPDEILVHILSFLSLKSDVYNISLTCARLQEVAVDRRILRRLDVRRDPKFSKKALSFFTEPNISDKIQDVDITCVSWIKPWELMKKLPSLTKFSFSVHRRCTHGDPKDLVNMAKKEMIPHLKKLTHLKLVFDGRKEKLFNEQLYAYYSTTRYLIQLLEYCENLEHLKIYAKDVVWVTSEQFPVRPVKLSKLKFFVIQLEYTKRNELLENVARPIGAFIHKMLNQNSKKLKGWCEVNWGGSKNLGVLRNWGVSRNCMCCKDLIVKMLHDFGIAEEEQE